MSHLPESLVQETAATFLDPRSSSFARTVACVMELPVSADYFRVLRTPLAAGVAFTRADERHDARVALVSARVSREYLGGQAPAVGKLLTLNGIPHRVQGVMPEGFQDPFVPDIDIWRR